MLPADADARGAAVAYCRRGWSPIGLGRGEKAIYEHGWTALRLTAEEAGQRIAADGNVGIILGTASGGLVDIDLDTPEAVELADRFLPPTVSTFGRAGKPRSHRLYRVEPAPFTLKFRDPTDGVMLVELRADGGVQTVFPPSLHPSGERIAWHQDGQPTQLFGGILHSAVTRLAAACLVFRHGSHGDAAVLDRPVQDWVHALAEAPAKVREQLEEWLGALGAGVEEDPMSALRDLIGRAKIDPGAPFAPEVLAQLGAAKTGDRAGFETLRRELKQAGVRVTALDEAITAECGGAGTRAPTQADILIELAAVADLFHAPDRTGYADLDIEGHRETWPIRGKGFRRWLSRRFYVETRGAPSSEALQSALNVIEAKAHFDAPERAVFVRVAGDGNRLFLDLADERWRAIEIGPDGWCVISNPPVRFRRAAGMRPLPAPLPGGSVEVLRSSLNVRTQGDFVLVVAWALAALRHSGPYPVLVLSGEQGSAKSTFAAMLRALLDPNTAPLRALPREDRDLFIAASNGHVLAFDNVSGLPAWISDTLCRLATGGGFAVRQLYTDQDEVLFEATRPMILNGIEDIVTRPDLADRAIFLTLEPIPEEARLPERQLWAEFEAERPRLLGALLDAVSLGLRKLPETHLDRLPRMADFALWATACEGAIWHPGTFEAAYCGNRDDAVEGVVDADPVATAVRSIVTSRTAWTGTASELLGALGEVAGEAMRKGKTWPDTPRALAGRLRRAANFLRKIGIDIVFTREGRARTRTIHIYKSADDAGARPSAPSAGRPDGRPRTGSGQPPADGSADGAVGRSFSIVCDHRPEYGDTDHADGTDDGVRPSAGNFADP